MAKHDHNTCDHTLQVCAHCDVAHCTKCKKEWGAPCFQNHYPPYGWHVTPVQPYMPYTWPLYTTIVTGGLGSVGTLGTVTNGYVEVSNDTYVSVGGSFSDTSLPEKCDHQ